MKKIILIMLILNNLLSSDRIVGKWDIETINKNMITILAATGNKFYLEFDKYKNIKDENKKEIGTWQKIREDIYMTKTSFGTNTLSQLLIDENMKKKNNINRKIK